jgi:predicted aspartyl protease
MLLRSRCEVLRIRDTVEFLVATGASRTAIRGKDIIRLGIDFSRLKKVSRGMFGTTARAKTVLTGDL